MEMNRSMSIDTDFKVVQTQLDLREYERLRRVADEEGLSLKEVLRRAATEFVDRHERHDPTDPFFAGPDPDVEGEDSLSAAETDEYLYGDG